MEERKTPNPFTAPPGPSAIPTAPAEVSRLQAIIDRVQQEISQLRVGVVHSTAMTTTTMRWWISHTRSPGEHQRLRWPSQEGMLQQSQEVEVSSPSARHGLWGARVGEASNPGPVECSTGATQPDTESDDTSDTESVRHGPDFHTICTDVERPVGASAPIGGEQRIANSWR